MFVCSGVTSHFSSKDIALANENTDRSSALNQHSGAIKAATVPNVQQSSACTTKFTQVSKESITDELERFKELQKSHPEYAIQILKLGQDVIRLAATGDAVSLANILLFQAREGEVLQWALCKGFREACLNGHLMVVRLLIKHGLSSKSVGLEELPFDLLEQPKCNEEKLVPILNELYQSGGYCINQMRKTDSKTALHICCEYGLLNTIKFLLVSRCDVNPISDDDSMPLSLLKDSNGYSDEKLMLIQLMSGMGASETLM